MRFLPRSEFTEPAPEESGLAKGWSSRLLRWPGGSTGAIFGALLAVLVALPAATSPQEGTTTPGAADVNIPDLADADRLQTILDRFDAAQQEISTLQADFSEHKQLAMLTEPLISEGRFFYARPDKAKWAYAEPDEQVFVISETILQHYIPADKTLGRRDLRAANTNRLFKLFGLGQTSSELLDFYDISLGDDNDQPNTYLLVLKPRHRLVSKRISRVLLWVDDRDFLPTAMRHEQADGDFTYLEFSGVQINETLDGSTFTLELPDDVHVKDEISIFKNNHSNGSNQ